MYVSANPKTHFSCHYCVYSTKWAYTNIVISYKSLICNMIFFHKTDLIAMDKQKKSYIIAHYRALLSLRYVCCSGRNLPVRKCIAHMYLVLQLPGYCTCKSISRYRNCFSSLVDLIIYASDYQVQTTAVTVPFRRTLLPK